MKIKQLTVFIENRPGRLADVTAILQGAGIDIRALSLADTSDFGILRLIVSRPAEAAALLREAGAMATMTDVLAVSMRDEPGGFAGVARHLSEAGINIEYLYAFVSRNEGEAVVILRADDPDKGGALLQKAGVRLLGDAEVYNL